MPLYRQEKHLERFGVTIPRQTLANWNMYGAMTWLSPLYDQMRKHLLKQNILHADETTLQVLSEPERPAQSKSYMRSEEHTSELQSRGHLVCRLLHEKKTARDQR